MLAIALFIIFFSTACIFSYSPKTKINTELLIVKPATIPEIIPETVTQTMPETVTVIEPETVTEHETVIELETVIDDVETKIKALTKRQTLKLFTPMGIKRKIDGKDKNLTQTIEEILEHYKLFPDKTTEILNSVIG